MGDWYDRKKKGLCTKCGLRAGTSKRGLLCDSCLTEVRVRNAEYNKVVLNNPYQDQNNVH